MEHKVRLEDLKPDCTVSGILPTEPVTVVSVKWFGSNAIELIYKSVSGGVTDELLYRGDEDRLKIVTQGRPSNSNLIMLGGRANRPRRYKSDYACFHLTS